MYRGFFLSPFTKFTGIIKVPSALLFLFFFGLSMVSQAQEGCIDPTDLTSSYVTGYYGTFNNPYQHTGIVNYGSSSRNSRHTVHTSTTQTDPRTGNNLHTVPTGASASVRLGNWNTGADAEALLYMLVVDTLQYDLLILKYAAVLENPGHIASRQPRFRLEILNSNMQVIDPTCGLADFIASSALGWNNQGGVLWKDWTNVGIDLAPYAGQTIYVRLTTYDCYEGGHFGYAYFTLECARKSIQSMSCGEVGPNSFTAPMGFNYQWYTDSVTQSVISTSRTLYTTGNEDAEYFYCRISFVDQATCNFTMNAYAGSRYPLANIDTVVTPQPCGYEVSFINRSLLSADGVTPLGNGEGCETAFWDFGDGYTSTQYHATHYYANGGDYTVTLISGLANNACTDTTQISIHLEPIDTIAYISGPTERCFGTPPDTLFIVGAGSSSWTANRAIVSPTTTTTYNVDVVDVRGCPVSLSHTLAVNPVHQHHDYATVCSNQLPYSYESLSITQAAGTEDHQVVYPNIYGCDSSFTLSLTVKDTSHTDTAASACDEFLWHGQLFSASTDSAYFRTFNSVGCDSVVTLHLTIRYSTSAIVADTVVENHLPHLYHGHSFSSDVEGSTIVFPNAQLCDSVVSYSLLVRWNDSTYLDSSVCVNRFPVSWGRLTFTEPGDLRDTMLNQYGADSILFMSLGTYPVFDDTIDAEICDYQWYSFGDNVYSLTGVYTDSLSSIHGCDSVSSLNLLVHSTPSVSISYDSLCHSEQYRLHLATDAPYTRWLSIPHDSLIDGHEHEGSVIVSPVRTTRYVAWADIYESPFCPVTDTLVLNPLVAAHAELKVVPEVLEYGNLEYAAYDISHNSEPRIWYLDGYRLPSTDYSISGVADINADSLVIALEHYNGQCHDTAIRVVPIYRDALFPPNVFTPLQDINNRFFIGSSGVNDAELYIYNRDGILVFQTTDIEQGWDGRDLNGTLCPQGSYVWRLLYHTVARPNKLRTSTGSVLLLR